MTDQRLINFASILIILFLTIYALIVGRFLLLPFVVAILIWYLTVSLTETYQELPLLPGKIPYPIALTLSLLTTGFLIYGVVVITSRSFTGILHDIPQYQAKLQHMMSDLEIWSGRKINLTQWLAGFSFANIITMVMSSVTALASNIVLITIYVLFLLVEYKTFPNKLKAITKTDRHYRETKDTLDKINQDIKMYLKIKTVMSTMTGFLSYLLLFSFGVDNAEFWGIFIFLLNYIPYVGPLVGVFIPLLAISIQFTWSTLTLLAIALTAIHLILGNIIEPRYMSKHLNLSPLVILLALGFWGSIWGVIGMFLCIPFMTIINITLSKFDRTRPISIMLSA